MADERDQERTEPATPRRRREARERGHVARSADLAAAAVLLAAVAALHFLGGRLVEGIFGASSNLLGRLSEMDGSPDLLRQHVSGAFLTAIVGFAPIALVIVAAAVGVNLVQVGFLFTGETLAPKWERLDPVAGLRRIFSTRSATRLLMGVLKLTAVAIVAAATIWAERSRLASLGGHAFDEVVKVGTGLLLTLALRAALVLLVLAILEYGIQRWQYDRDLRMSRHEIREELRRFEGDPKIRERRRALQRRLATHRMVRDVPRATVVLTDADRLSVAIEYRKDEMDAPVVVAKGAGDLDRRIREGATEHGVPIVERPDLARLLYRKIDVGRAIPGETYPAVAEVLAYACRLKGLAAA